MKFTVTMSFAFLFCRDGFAEAWGVSLSSGRLGGAAVHARLLHGSKRGANA